MQKNNSIRPLLLLSAAAILFALAFFLGRATLRGTTIEAGRRGAQASVQDDWIQTAAKKAAQAQARGQICLNTATLEQLMRLPGVGQKTAERILSYRETYGRFSAVEQLLDVPGIGERLLEQLRAYVYVEDGYENSGG